MQEALKASKAQEEVLTQTHSRLEADMHQLQQRAVADKQKALDLQNRLEQQQEWLRKAYSRLSLSQVSSGKCQYAAAFTQHFG